MYKIYCTVITPRIRAIAKSLGVSDSFANNLVSTWQSCKNQPGIEPSIDELKEFMESNKDAMRLIQLAMPIYDTMSDPNYGPGAMVHQDGSITLNMFESNEPYSALESLVEEVPYLKKHKDLITDFKSFYALELYAAKLRINRGALSEPTSKEDYDYAAKLLKQAKREFPNEFPTVKRVASSQSSTVPSQKINIYTGVKENTHLSNFAERPFTISYESISDIMKEIEEDSEYTGEWLYSVLNEDNKFHTVEGAFQAAKLAFSPSYREEGEYTNEAIKLIKMLMSANGPEAKSIGRSIKDLDSRLWDKYSSSIMKLLIRTSFEQNPDALQQLLATGNAQLTHTQDKGKWGTEFPRILMEVRNELSTQAHITSKLQEDNITTTVLGADMVKPEEASQEVKEAPSYVPDPNDVPKIGIEILSIDRENPRARLTRDFTPFELQSRVENIARRFTNIVDEMVEELISKEQEEMASATGNEREEIEARLKKLTDPVIGRRVAIQALTFNKIYERIRDEFKEYAETSEEDFDMMYGEGNGHIIKEKYQRIVDNFEALFNDACTIIEGAENLRVVLGEEKYNNGKTTEERIDAVVEKSTLEEDKEEEEFGDDEEGQRTTGNDGWSFKVRFVDPYSSLSADVKKALHDIKRVKPNGEDDLDDLGNVRYLSDSYIHSVLIDKLSSMIDADDFSAFDEDGNLTFPALEAIAETYPWVNQIINKLEADPSLASLFFADFRKDFIPYWKQKIDEKGQLSPMPLNQPIALDSTLSSVTQNYDQGTVLDEDSIYDNLRKVNVANAKKGTEIADEALASFQELEDDEDFERLAENVNKGLRMLGFRISPNTIPSLLKTELGIVSVENVVRAMGEIFEAAQTLEDNTHLIDALNEPYKKIAGIVGEVTELDNIQSFREGDKTHYSYSAPNYVDTMFKLFKSNKRRQEYIDSEFKFYDWFFNKKTNQWNNEWLRLLESDTDVQDKLALKEINSIDKQTKNGVAPSYYTEWTPSQIKESFVLEYFSAGENKGSKKQFAWYNFPIFSDSPVVKFVRFLRYTDDFESQLLPLFNKVVRQELGRIKLVEERAKVGASKIQNFDKVGAEFHFFPELNSVMIDGKSFLDTIREMSDAKDVEGIEKLINEQVKAIMNNNFNKFLNEYQSYNPNGNLSIIDTLIQKGIATTPKGAIDKLREYFWNQSFATSQIIQLTTTDLAFYKNGTDFQKRYKEVYAAGTKLNTNSKYGRKKEKTIYLSDNIITSANYLDIKKNLIDAMKEGRLTRIDVDNILSKFKDINVADAQAYRSISSFRSILDMMGLWNEEMEAAVNRFTHDEWDMSDFDIVWQTIKPFVFTQIDKPNGIGGRMKVPHQNKNSEFLLLSTFSMIANRMNKSPKIVALNRFMEDNQIDVSQFESAVKAGGQGIIDISVSESKVQKVINEGSVTVKGKEYSLEAKSFRDIKKHFDRLLDNGNVSQEEYNSIMGYFEPSEQEVYNMLESATKDEAGNFKEEVVHEIPYSDYVVQQPTPEHLFDVEAVFGSQFRNLLISDMPEDIEISVNGTTIKGRDNIINLYQSLIVENLLEDYQKLSRRFATIEDLQKAMLETIKGNPKYGRDMLDALQIVEHTVNGEKVKTFNIPLHNPSTTVKIQELVNSMFKNAITKQHIKGGNCILVSNFGFTNKLHILRNEDGSVKGAECYMPFYTKEHFKPFLKDVVKDGKVIGQEVDINAIREQDPELLKMVGYRIPTEDKYSMLPLVIKGFLPQQNGSAIMLPADVTQIAGSDFDVDKLFLMIPEFNVYKYNKKKALEDFRKLSSDQASKDLIDSIFKVYGNKTDEDLDTSDLEREDTGWKEWWETNKDKYEYENPRIRKVRYKNNEAPEANNRRQRNNMIIDIAFGILTHKDTAEKINNPGSFDKAKLAARIALITNDRDILNAYAEENNLSSINDIINSLLNSDLDTLDGILKKYKRERSPLSVDTFIYNHRQNMTGGALIGMYANNTTMQAKFQRTRLALKDNNTFVVNGRKIQSLHEAYVKIGDTNERISKNCANFSAASVDNVKDPVLADLLQNTKTANIAGFMLRAGMSIQEIGLFFTQPIVRECIENTGDIKDIKKIIQAYIDKLKYLEGWVNIKGILKKDFTSEELLRNILLFNGAKWLGEEVAEGSDDPINMIEEFDGVDIRDILASNIQSAALFMHIADMSNSMSDLTKICRADSPNGAIARSIARMKNQTHRVDSYIRRSKKDDFPFVGIEDIMRNNFISPEMSIDVMRLRLNSATMPMLQAFYSLGIDFGQKLDSRYFAQLNPYTNELVEELYRNSTYDSISDKLLEKFYSELVTFGLSKTTTFGNDENNTFDQKRDYYLYDFPREFLNIITNPANKNISNLNAIKKLRVKNGEIIMDRSGRLTPAMREMLMRDFDSLLYMDETARKLAVDLFMYSYYKDGFNFGPNSFGNFFSTNFITSFPEVTNALRDMSFNINSESYWNRFLEQFYANHFKDGTLVPGLNELDNTIKEGAEDSLIVQRKDVVNTNLLGNKVFKYIRINSNLFQVDSNQIGEKEVVYTPVKTHNDPQGTKYNANMTASEMAEIEVDESRVEAAKSTAVKKELPTSNVDEEDLTNIDFSSIDALFADTENEEYNFKDGLSSINEKPCNI